MSASKDETPIFKQDANATPVSEIKPPAPDPRRARVSKVHAEIARQVKTGDIYRQPRKSR
jgi:hypothetical protein